MNKAIADFDEIINYLQVSNAPIETIVKLSYLRDSHIRLRAKLFVYETMSPTTININNGQVELPYPVEPNSSSKSP